MFGFVVSDSKAVSIIPVPKTEWTCYDYSVDFAKENTSWGIVTMSDNQWFNSNCGISHMVNYQVINETSLMIHDGLYDVDYILKDWTKKGFFHFWEGRPVRNYLVMQDNRDVILSKSRQSHSKPL